jgi:D-alanyl-D-alanine carboxypeptidase
MPDVLVAVVEDGLVLEETSDAAVPWWSFTKLVIAAGALALVAEGKLELDAPLDGHPFSLRQLLQHRAGLPDYGGLPAYEQAVESGEEPWDERVLKERAGASRLRFEPGKGWAYSNIGYLLVRRLIERATAESLDTALRRLVLSPLGIAGPRIAATRVDLESTAWGNARKYHPGWAYHGFMVGSPASAALLLWRIMTCTLLPEALRSQLVDACPIGSGPVPGRPWRAPAYGLGLMIDAATGYAGHTGEGPGSTAAVYFAPRRAPRRVVAVFANHENAAMVEQRAATLLT